MRVAVCWVELVVGVVALIVPTNPTQKSPLMLVQSLGSEASCALNRRSENVVVEAIIVPELELRNVKMQVLLTDVVEGADDPALDDRPEALNRVRGNRADNVFLGSMVDSDVLIAFLAEAVVSNPLIGAEQANLVRYSFADEGFQCGGLDVSDHASDDIALAADCASDDCALATALAMTITK